MLPRLPRAFGFCKFVFLFFALLSSPAWGVKFISVGKPVAILYDAPSLKADKRWLIRKNSPLETVIPLKQWIKVRDAEGTLAWIQAVDTMPKRMLQVTADIAPVYQEAAETSYKLYSLDKGVLIQFISPPKDGWIKIQHRGSPAGYIRMTQVFGLE